MKKILFAALILLNPQQLVFAESPKANNEDLAGSTFVCPYKGMALAPNNESLELHLGAKYTFYLNNKFNFVPGTFDGRLGDTISSIDGKPFIDPVDTISYNYDGKFIRLIYVRYGKQMTLNYEAKYLKAKRKLILMDKDGNQAICDEQ